MLDETRDPRTRWAYKTLCRPGPEPPPVTGPEPAEDELVLAARPTVENRIDDMMVDAAVEDLRLCLEAFGLPPDRSTATTLVIRLDDTEADNKRNHTLEVSDHSITVTGATPWGAAAGLYHLQRLMLLRGGPILKRGTLRGRPRLDPSLAYPAFKRDTMMDLDYPEAWDEHYLRSVARAGYTGIHVNLSVGLFIHSADWPELNHPQAEANLRTLGLAVERARRCCLDVYLSYYTEVFPHDHPLFQRCPSMRGSPLVGNSVLHVLCISSPRVRQVYREHFRTLFEAVPELAGVLLIVGCEGFLHCHTAPVLDGHGNTTCPACASANPEQTVATMMNDIAASITETAPGAHCIVWTYGVHTWTDDNGLTLLDALSPRCEVMTNFDTGDNFTLHGATGHCFDYSLRCVGPSTMFCEHQDVCRGRGLQLLAKCESGHPLECYSFPTLPANTRWGRKYRSIVDSDAVGALFNWKFLGFTGAHAEELAGWMSWQGYDDPQDLLRRMARRDFGPQHVDAVMAAWSCFDRAMDHHPFSLETAGYFKGPFYIAFAHPLIVDPTRIDGLDEAFWSGGLDEHALGPRRRTRFVVDLSWVQPFGVEAMLSALHEMERLWHQGCNLLPDDPVLDVHKALAEALLCMLRTAINVTAFYDQRDRLFREPATLESYNRGLCRLRDIARRELANAEAGLACMERNPMIGFQYTYRATFTRSMVEKKLAHTRTLIEKTLPHLWYSRRFNHGLKAGWLDERPYSQNGDQLT